MREQTAILPTVIVIVVSGTDYHHGVEMLDADKVKVRGRRDEMEGNEHKANNVGTPCNHLDITHIKWNVPSRLEGPAGLSRSKSTKSHDPASQPMAFDFLAYQHYLYI